jgi:hypothetical protein
VEPRFRHRPLPGILSILLVACATPPSRSPTSEATQPASPLPSHGAATDAASTAAHAGLVVEVRNEDDVPYQIAWAQDLSRVEWIVEPSSIGHFEVASAQHGALLLTQACNFVDTWERVDPGSYSITVRDGAARLEAVLFTVPSLPLTETDPCFVEGP